MARELKPKPEYSCEYVDEAEGIFKITKLEPPDYDPGNEYIVQSHNGRYSCDCFAGLKGTFCRHLQLVDLFKANPDKIGSRHTYNWDRKHWS
jgi:hypothetical protein